MSWQTAAWFLVVVFGLVLVFLASAWGWYFMERARERRREANGELLRCRACDSSNLLRADGVYAPLAWCQHCGAVHSWQSDGRGWIVATLAPEVRRASAPGGVG